MSRATGVLDRALYALFSRRADRVAHADDRRAYRGTTVTTDFDVLVARLYGLAWTAGVACGAVLLALALGPLVGATRTAAAGLPLDTGAATVLLAGSVAALGALAGRWLVIRAGGLVLRALARARRTDIERTLPGAARYLHALAHGSHTEREMVRRVAAQTDAYGETAVAFRKVLTTAQLTGSLDTGLRRVARDTPAQDALAPFLLKFREHADQGTDALAGFLELETRMLGRRQERQRRAAEGFLELVAELFVVLLVLPTLLVIVLTVLGTLSPALAAPVATPLGTVTVRALLVYASAGFVLVVGLVVAAVVHAMQPPNVVTGHHAGHAGLARLRHAAHTPADAAVVCLPLAPLAGLVAAGAGVGVVTAALLGYAAYGLPVGLVAIRRARIDDAKDGQMTDFVHAVSGHVNLGRPLPDAVERVAREVNLGPLDPDVDRLAFALSVTSRGDDVRSAALSGFVADVGTPLAEQTVGLLSGALDVGSDAGTVLDALQAEVGRLYHARKTFRANLLVYAAVGWTTALLVVGVMVAVNLQVVGSFDQLAEVSSATGGFVLQGDAVDPARDRERFYLVTQATMLACGWFAGYASRGRYEALLHSGALVVLCWLVFTGAGAV